MANVQSLCTSFERDWFSGYHDFVTDTIKGALYYVTANLNYDTTAYTTAGEVTGLNYPTGGVVVDTSQSPQSVAKTTYWNPGLPIIYPQMTVSTPFNAVLLYNASKANRAIGVWTFNATTLDWRVFTLQLPPMTYTQALLRFNQP